MAIRHKQKPDIGIPKDPPNSIRSMARPIIWTEPKSNRVGSFAGELGTRWNVGDIGTPRISLERRKSIALVSIGPYLISVKKR